MNSYIVEWPIIIQNFAASNGLFLTKQQTEQLFIYYKDILPKLTNYVTYKHTENYYEAPSKQNKKS